MKETLYLLRVSTEDRTETGTVLFTQEMVDAMIPVFEKKRGGNVKYEFVLAPETSQEGETVIYQKSHH